MDWPLSKEQGRLPGVDEEVVHQTLVQNFLQIVEVDYKQLSLNIRTYSVLLVERHYLHSISLEVQLC